MKGKKKTLIVPVLLLLVGLTCGYVANTYAKYASKIDDNSGTATVAKWNFTEENQNTELTIDLTGTPDASTLKAERIAPGTKGSFNIVLKNSTTETGVDFTVKLKEKTDTNKFPTNLKFCKEAACTTVLTPGTSTITGKLIAEDPTGLTIPIYWEWPLGDSNEVTDTTNEADTADGETAAENGMTIGVEITGVQTAPSETAIESHFTVN